MAESWRGPRERGWFLALSLLLVLCSFLVSPESGRVAAQAPAAELFIDQSLSADTAIAIRKTISASLDYTQTGLGRSRNRPFRAFFLPNSESVYKKWAEVYRTSVDVGQREFADSVGRVYMGQDLWMRMDDEGIIRKQPGRLEKILAHEVFHLVQAEFENFSGRTGATWLREGSAEFVGYRVADAMGALPWQAARQQLISNVSSRGLLTRPGILQLAEEGRAFSSLNQTWNVLYQYTALAVEFLAGNTLPSIRRYHEGLGGGLDWREGFRSAYGRSPEEFYKQWEALAPTLQR